MGTGIHDIVVIGASAGGIEALQQLVTQFPADLPAAIFVVVHTSPYSPGYLASMLDVKSMLPVQFAEDELPIQHGTIYVAPPDYHLLLKFEKMYLGYGPQENWTRPAINVLFRSAAVAYRSRVIGVLLTGLLDDGVSGLAAIRRCGGITLVQDPDDAAFPDMPRSAIENDVVDYTSSLDEMGVLINQLVGTPVDMNTSIEVPPDLIVEVDIAARIQSNGRTGTQLGELVPLSCPECNGPLWELHGEQPKRFRCTVGHAFTAQTLLIDQGSAVEKALWLALRTLEERVNLLRSLAKDASQRKLAHSTDRYDERIRDANEAIKTIRMMLMQTHELGLSSHHKV